MVMMPVTVKNIYTFLFAHPKVNLFNRMLPQSGKEEEAIEEHFPQSQEDAVSISSGDDEDEEEEEEEEEMQWVEKALKR